VRQYEVSDITVLERAAMAIEDEATKEVLHLAGGGVKEYGEMRDAQGHIRGLRQALQIIENILKPPAPEPEHDEEE
jgi:hypothetical protein